MRNPWSGILLFVNVGWEHEKIETEHETQDYEIINENWILRPLKDFHKIETFKWEWKWMRDKRQER